MGELLSQTLSASSPKCVGVCGPSVLVCVDHVCTRQCEREGDSKKRRSEEGEERA